MMWVNITAVGEANEVQMDAYAGSDASERARFRHRPCVLLPNHDMVKDWNVVREWKPGLPEGHRMKKAPKCARCKDTGWLDPIGPCSDDSYITSRPCSCNIG